MVLRIGLKGPSTSPFPYVRPLAVRKGGRSKPPQNLETMTKVLISPLLILFSGRFSKRPPDQLRSHIVSMWRTMRVDPRTLATSMLAELGKGRPCPAKTSRSRKRDSRVVVIIGAHSPRQRGKQSAKEPVKAAEDRETLATWFPVSPRGACCLPARCDHHRSGPPGPIYQMI